MPPESSRQGQKLLLSLIGAVCAFLATRKIMFHSKYLQLPVEQIRKLSEGDVGFLPEDSIYRFNIFNKITFLYLSAVEDKDLKLCAFLKVLVSYHGLSKRAVAKMAGVEVKDIERMLSNPPKKVPEDIKPKTRIIKTRINRY